MQTQPEDHPMPKSTYPDSQQLILDVLGKAQSGFKNAFGEVHKAAIAKNTKDNGVLLHDAWMLSMYRAFTEAYQKDPRRITVFAKPLKSRPVLPDVKAPYNRGEYGFDLAVVEMRTEDAPYRKVGGKPIQVEVVVHHLWQVESEIRNDATKLSEDLGKLTGGAAPCKLLVTLIPQQQDDGAAWRTFIERAAQHVPGQLYVAMVRSYGGKNGRQAWIDGTPEVRIFQRRT
jgi:hypothetical protein